MSEQSELLSLPATGSTIARADDALDVIGDVWGHQATVVAIPATRFADDFFDLSTRVAGEFVQKFVNYRILLVVVGELATPAPTGSALAAFIAESNRGRHLWFVRDDEELQQRLAAR